MCFESMNKQMHKLEKKNCNTKFLLIYLGTKGQIYDSSAHMQQNMTV